MKDHIEKYSKFPVTCPNSCGVLTLREMIANHTEDDCPLTMMPCPYEQMGCKTKIQRREMGSHLQSAMRLHLDLACVKINTTEETLNETRKLGYITQN
ncbi:TNF receptor-associated factor 4-like [Orbicella faveolata]|uniref:TNF receptor-associated factor 4-like n=1 Tax=Orbicella faveolata TaxID=48498 RepID=UPI0009E48894|nr:TNF receptor-associated factor 4-like [Orbicella faveolata]